MPNTQKTIKLGLLGSGTVGSGVIEVIRKNGAEIAKKIGAELEIKKVLIRPVDRSRPQLKGLDLTEDIEDILKDDEISIVIELIGGLHPAREFMLRALESGKSVVTANKDVVSTSGKELFAMAAEKGVDFRFEASVGGGIPIITPLKECLTANKITEVMGIVNGTTNYMLTKMAECGSDYDTVLKEAQEKGYAEANPSADVDGLDAARKIAILASIAFNSRISLDDVNVEGITKITPLDIEYAKELGYTIKLLAIGKEHPQTGIDVRVHPMLLPNSHPLAAVSGVFNAIFVHGNAIGDAMFYGQGAGSLPTASAVVSDIISIAKDIKADTFGRMGCTCYAEKPLCPLDESEASYYIRLLVADKPGVLGSIATVFGNEGVSLQSVMQTKRAIVDHAEIVVITHMIKHRQMAKALASLSALPVVDEVRNIIRVESNRG